MTLTVLILVTTFAVLVQGNVLNSSQDVAESYVRKEAAIDHDSPEDKVTDEFEKKYFDYLPNDLESESSQHEKSSDELYNVYVEGVSADHGTALENPRRVNSRKLKRDLTSHKRHKRQESADSNNPWKAPGKLHPPGNFYLPPSRPGQNNPQPPHNPNTGFETDDRGFFEEDDTAQRVWPNSGAGKGGSAKPVTTTYRPPPKTDNTIDFIHNPQAEAEELEIELPPNIFDDDRPLTTRAPLTRPTLSASNKSPNRNPSRNVNRAPSPTSPPFPTTTPGRLKDTTPKSRQQKELPPCVVAIVNCCSRYDQIVRVSCFEKYNCSGMFFGANPCSPDIQASAISELEKYSR